MRFVRALAAGSSFALRALILLIVAQSVAIFVHEGLHLQQAWLDGERDDLRIFITPLRNQCGGFVCASDSSRYDPDLFWWGEGFPRLVDRIVFFEVVLGFAPWVWEPLRRRAVEPK